MRVSLHAAVLASLAVVGLSAPPLPAEPRAHGVQVSQAPTPAPTPAPDIKILKQQQTGTFPGGQLFGPLMADPRWPHFSASYQYYVDDPQLRSVGAVSFGETIAIYRDRVGRGWWEIGIQAGIFSIFDLYAESKDLINTDFFASLLGGYQYRDFSAILRLAHQSSHLGDEYLLRSRQSRINLSWESVDVKASQILGEIVRLYAGAGYLFDQEPSSLKPWSVQAGVEFNSPWPPPTAGIRPVGAIDVQGREENDWTPDLSIRAGVQIDGVIPTRRLQLLLEYFRGHSPNGQFFEQRLEYFGFGTHFHF
jgi:Protein of unknown function (DUF1207)